MPTSDWKCSGNVAEHTAWPRVRCVMVRREDGAWECFDPEFIDDRLERGMDGKTLAKMLAKLMREGGDVFAAHKRLQK